MTDRKPLASDFAPHGVDVSEFQAPSQIPVSAEFVIVRACFGTRRDKRTLEHVRACRDTGRKVGLYLFPLMAQSIADQADCFAQVMADAGVGEPDDLIAWVDIEPPDAAGKMLPNPAWCEPLLELFGDLASRSGVGAYISDLWFRALGSPAWLLEFPLWVPHYRTSPGMPASPGGVRPALWQYRVGPWSRGALHKMGQDRSRSAIDHDCALGPLPLIGLEPEDHTVPDAAALFTPELHLDDEYWTEHNRVRDRMVRGG